MDWIQGDKFQKLATYTYAPPKLDFYDYAKISNTLDVDLLKDGDFIFVVGFNYYKHALLDLIRGSKKVVLISHNCDQCIDETYNIPKNVVKWYSQNIAVVDEKLQSLPIGLPNDIWYPEIRKIEKMESMLSKPKEFKNLVYLDHRTWTNRLAREKPYEILENKIWVTSIRDTTRDTSTYTFDRFLDNLYNHKFMICPDGNGLDTHRVWEAFYMKTIPIQIRNINNSYFEELPICLVNDWEEVTEEFLINWLIKNQNRRWNMDMLNFSYWKDMILNTKII